MYVDPFWIGVVLGAAGTVAILFALAGWMKSKRDKGMF